MFVNTWQDVIARKYLACFPQQVKLLMCPVDLCPSSAGASAGEAQGDVPEDAGTAAARREVPPQNDPGAGLREEEARRLHEQERRLHQPPGAGAGTVSRMSLNPLTLAAATQKMTLQQVIIMQNFTGMRSKRRKCEAAGGEAALWL